MIMYQVSISKLKPGMKVARNVFSSNGRLLIAEGTVLTYHYIRKLEIYEIASIYISDDKSNSNRDSFFNANTKNELIYKEAISAISDIMNKVKNSAEIDVKMLMGIVDEIVYEIMEDSFAFIQLNSIRDLDNYTYLHSIDVCIYSIILGKSYGLPQKLLNKLGTGAMLHDIGKGKVPSEILLKPGPLTYEEFEIMKKHTLWGYEAIMNCPNVDREIANIALNHHERWDGKGYPNGIRGYGIDYFSRVVTICDIYDALTADRVYRSRILPHEAAEYILNSIGTIADPELAKKFIKNVSIYPVGTTVLLNTGEIGRVTRINEEMPLRPVIQIFSNTDKDYSKKGYDINLMEKLTVFICDVIR